MDDGFIVKVSASVGVGILLLVVGFSSLSEEEGMSELVGVVESNVAVATVVVVGVRSLLLIESSEVSIVS